MNGETDIRDIVLNEVKDSIIPTIVLKLRRQRMQIHPDEHETDIYEQLDIDVSTQLQAHFYNKTAKDITIGLIDRDVYQEKRLYEHAQILCKTNNEDAIFQEYLWDTDSVWLTTSGVYLHINSDEYVKVVGEENSRTKGYNRAEILHKS
tara:strand:- start:321 stop:767 length:447 start_codon:yes stop_codon:yes gene_type:complete